jgi:phosphate-selective porin OprO and OprP
MPLSVRLCSGLAVLLLSPLALAQPALKPGLFLHYDLSRIDTAAPAPLRGASGWRRARISLAASWDNGVDAKLEHDFSSDTFTDAYLRLPLAAGRLWLGQFKQPFSADALQSDSQALLTESSVAAAFAPGRRLGLQYARGGFAASVYGRDLHGSGPERGIALRGFGQRGSAATGLSHFGASAAREWPQDDLTSLRLRPDLGPRSGSWLATGTHGAQTLQRVGVEAGWQRGRGLLLGEVLRLRAEAADGRSRSADGASLTAAWTLHGASREYRNGLFATPKPAGALGQLELVARYARIDLPHAAGGEIGQRGGSLGLNAQIGSHGRLMLARHHQRRVPDDADVAAWTLRLQLLY